METSFNMNELYGYGFIRQSQELYSSARTLELRFAIDPKDKMLDEICVRHLRRLAEALFEQGLNSLKLSKNIKDVTEEEQAKDFKQAVEKSNG